MVNKVILSGNVGTDPEIRSISNGRSRATFRFATSESWTDEETGEREKRTEWHRIVVFSPGLVELVQKFVRIGKRLVIFGKLRTSKWKDDEGVDRYSTEVIVTGRGGVIEFQDRAPRSDDDGDDSADAS